MNRVRVAIVDDHQTIIDGYMYRLEQDETIEVVATAYFGAQIRPLLEKEAVDVLLLDAYLPTSVDNPDTFQTLLAISQLIDDFPSTHILLISMHNRRAFVEFAIDAGISGYLLKDDIDAMQNLAAIIHSVAGGGIHLSDAVIKQLLRKQGIDPTVLSERQLEALTLCAKYPDKTLANLAAIASMAPSTMRNTLSRTYLKLGVHSRQAAVTIAQRQGLIPHDLD